MIGTIGLYYLQILLITIWFVTSASTALVVCLFRWRNPSNGYVFSRLFNFVLPYITGIHVKIHDENRLYEAKPCIYIGNHQDNGDIFIQSHCYTPRTVVIGKRELLRIPVFGLLFYAAGNILIQRQHHEKAMAGMEAAREVLTSGRASIYMFPEGTRNRGAEKLLPFKKGAFYMAVAAQVPLVPVVSAPNDRVVDFKKRKIYPGTAHVKVLEPIPTKGLNENDVPRLIDVAYSRMQKAYEEMRSWPKD